MTKRNPKKSLHKTSWDPVHSWYNQLVGTEGHYYHRKLIIPQVIKFLNLKNSNISLLDLACGQGILSRHIPKNTPYLGIDLSPELIKHAKSSTKNPKHDFLVADITKPLKIRKKYSHATLILAAQNLAHPDKGIRAVAPHLEKNGKLIIVLNHPCFRIPRQTSWEVDREHKIQYRRINRYMSPMKIPIQMHPGKGKRSKTTPSFHHPLSKWVKWLREAGFVLTHLEEMCSDKVSTGKMAKIENRARSEIPLFMVLVAEIQA